MNYAGNIFYKYDVITIHLLSLKYLCKIVAKYVRVDAAEVIQCIYEYFHGIQILAQLSE